MRRVILVIIVLAGMLGFAFAPSAQAAIVTYYVSASLERFLGPDAFGFDGASFLMTSAYDTAAAALSNDGVPDDYWRTSYIAQSGSITLTGTSGYDGTYAFGAGSASLRSEDPSYSSNNDYMYFSNDATIASTTVYNRANITFGSQTFLEGDPNDGLGDQLLLPLIDPFAFAAAGAWDYRPAGDDATYLNVINGSIYSDPLPLEAVPEPISLIFFGTGLVSVLGFVTRKAKRRARQS